MRISVSRGDCQVRFTAIDVTRYRRPVLVVTGAACFIGRHVLEQAAVMGAEVVAVDRRQTADERSICSSTSPTRQVATPDLLAALGSATAVIHLAGDGGVRSDAPLSPAVAAATTSSPPAPCSPSRRREFR